MVYGATSQTITLMRGLWLRTWLKHVSWVQRHTGLINVFSSTVLWRRRNQWYSLFALFRHLFSRAQICAHVGAYAVRRSLNCVPVSLNALHHLYAIEFHLQTEALPSNSRLYKEWIKDIGLNFILYFMTVYHLSIFHRILNILLQVLTFNHGTPYSSAVV